MCVFYDIRYHLLDCMNKLRKYLTTTLKEPTQTILVVFITLNL